MFRIDGPGAVGELPSVREGVSAPGFFGPGNPATGQMSTRVTYEWLNAVQEELMAVLEAAGVAPDKSRNDRLLAALKGLFASIDAQPYELCEFYFFRSPTLRPGFQPCQGGLITNAAAKYPDAWAYLQTEAGQLLCKTEAEWQAMTQATWGDGSFKASWNGIGGAPYFVQDLNAGTLRMPDLRGMFAVAAGDGTIAPGMGGVTGDTVRNFNGYFGMVGKSTIAGSVPDSGGSCYVDVKSGITQKLQTNTSTSGYWAECVVGISGARAVPTGAVNTPRAWGALVCAYLGQPVTA